MKKYLFQFASIYFMSLTLCYPVFAEIPTNKTPTVGNWQNLNDKWYFIDDNGNKVTGWIRYENNWYYCNNITGEMLANQATPDKYYVKKNGVWNGKETLKIFDFIESAPENQTFGWHRIKSNNSKQYFIDKKGEVLLNTWITVNDEYYYLDEDGYTICRMDSPDGFHINKNGKWDEKPSKYSYKNNKQPEVLPENHYYLPILEVSPEKQKIDIPNTIIMGDCNSTPKTKTWIKENGKMRYIYADGTYSINGWDSIENKWYYFDNDGYALVNQWVGDYYVDENGVMLIDTITPDGFRVGIDGVREGVYKAHSTRNINTPTYATYLADGTDALYPFILVGFVNQGNEPITIYQKNSSYKGAPDALKSICSSMKRYINENESEVCTSYTILPKTSTMIIFYINSTNAEYTVNSLLQFGLEYKGNGYMCNVTLETTTCVPLEEIGMTLDMFR